MKPIRDILFISHANPQDNEFAAWLNLRLQRLGYKTWCDLKGLKGGERDYWKLIENEIRNNAIKYLLVLSKSTFLKEGVLDEFEFAKSITQEYDLKDFVIPLRIEAVPFNARIGLNRYNQINFVESWAKGLNQLVEKLETDSIPFNNQIKYEDLAKDYNTLLKLDSFGINDSTEIHYSSFWPIPAYPEKFKVITFYNEKQAQHIYELNNNFPLIRHGNNIVTFEQDINLSFPGSDELIEPTNRIEISIESILKFNYERKSFPTFDDCEYLLKRLLNRTLHLFFKEKGLYWYELSNKTNCYYYPKGLIKKNKTTFSYHNRKKTKNVLGKYLREFYWHFGISFKTRLHPFLCYSLKTHLVFSDDGKNVWDDKSKLHRARRKKGKNWFNEEWRDQFFAFISALSDDDGKIQILFNSKQLVEMNFITQTFNSQVGYSEPKTKSRIDLINTYTEEEEYYKDDE